MPPPGAQGARDRRDKAASRDRDKSGQGARFGTPPAGTKTTSANIAREAENFAADNAKGPLDSLGLGNVGRTFAELAFPGIGLIDNVHGAAQFIGGGIRDILHELGAETTAPAIESGPKSIVGKDRSRSDTSNPILKAVETSEQTGTTFGIGEQILQQLGIEKISELFNLGESDEEENKEEKTSSKKKDTDSTPTQETKKPVQEAAAEREAGRSNLEKLFLDLINGKLDVKL